MVITIDGPAGAGKSTVARLVAERLGLRYVDTGAMYRELTAVALDRGTNLNDGEALAALVGEPAPEGADLRAEVVSQNVSAVSRHPQVRARMRARQRELAEDAVLEGRDTGSVVRPDADIKVFLVASADVRAHAARGRPRRGRRRRRPRVDRRARQPGQRAVGAGARRDGDRHGRPDRRAGRRADRLDRPAVTPRAGARRHLLARRAALGRAAVQGRAADPRARASRTCPARARCCWSPTTSRCGTSPRSARPSRGRSATWPSPSCSGCGRSARSCGWAATFAVRRGEADREALRTVHDTLEARRLRRHLHPGPPPGRASRRPRPGPGGWPWSRTRTSCRSRSAAADGAPAGRSRVAFGAAPPVRSVATARPSQAYRETADALMAEIHELYELSG